MGWTLDPNTPTLVLKNGTKIAVSYTMQVTPIGNIDVVALYRFDPASGWIAVNRFQDYTNDDLTEVKNMGITAWLDKMIAKANDALAKAFPPDTGGGGGGGTPQTIAEWRAAMNAAINSLVIEQHPTTGAVTVRRK